MTLPDVKGRQQILDLYLAGKPVAADVDTGRPGCYTRRARCCCAACWQHQAAPWSVAVAAQNSLRQLTSPLLPPPALVARAACRHPGAAHPRLQWRRAGQPCQRGGAAGGPPRQGLHQHAGGARARGGAPCRRGAGPPQGAPLAGSTAVPCLSSAGRALSGCSPRPGVVPAVRDTFIALAVLLAASPTSRSPPCLVSCSCWMRRATRS